MTTASPSCNKRKVPAVCMQEFLAPTGGYSCSVNQLHDFVVTAIRNLKEMSEKALYSVEQLKKSETINRHPFLDRRSVVDQ